MYRFDRCSHESVKNSESDVVREDIMEHKKKSRKKSVIQALTAVLLMGALGFLISYGVRIYTNMQDKNEYRDQGKPYRIFRPH